MKEQRIIGITGPAGSGKTTAAVLVARGLGLQLAGFADPIRRAVLELVPHWDEWHLEGGKDEPCRHTGLVPRHLLRTLGDHGRAMDPELYVRHLLARIAAGRFGAPPRVVVHDVRTEMEAQAVRDVGVLLHIQRPGVSWSADHGTEVGVSVAAGDLCVPNRHTLEALRVALEHALGVNLHRRAAA